MKKKNKAIKKKLKKVFKKAFQEIEKEYGDIFSEEEGDKGSSFSLETLEVFKSRVDIFFNDLDRVKNAVKVFDELAIQPKKNSEAEKLKVFATYEEEIKNVLKMYLDEKIDIQKLGMIISRSYQKFFLENEKEEVDSFPENNKLLYLKYQILALDNELNGLSNQLKKQEEHLSSHSGLPKGSVRSIEQNLDIIRKNVQQQEELADKYAKEVEKNIEKAKKELDSRNEENEKD